MKTATETGEYDEIVTDISIHAVMKTATERKHDRFESDKVFQSMQS